MNTTQKYSDDSKTSDRDQTQAAQAQREQRSDSGHDALSRVTRRQASDGHLSDDEPDDEAGSK